MNVFVLTSTVANVCAGAAISIEWYCGVNVSLYAKNDGNIVEAQ